MVAGGMPNKSARTRQARADRNSATIASVNHAGVSNAITQHSTGRASTCNKSGTLPPALITPPRQLMETNAHRSYEGLDGAKVDTIARTDASTNAGIDAGAGAKNIINDIASTVAIAWNQGSGHG